MEKVSDLIKHWEGKIQKDEAPAGFKPREEDMLEAGRRTKEDIRQVPEQELHRDTAGREGQELHKDTAGREGQELHKDTAGREGQELHKNTAGREDREQDEPWEGPYYVTLDLEDGTELECEALASFTIRDKSYIALIPIEDNGEGEVYLYRAEEGEDDSIILENIEDDGEYQEAADLFEKIFSGGDLEEDFSEGDFSEADFRKEEE